MSPLASAIYKGKVAHTRVKPRRHAFEFPLFMMYIDLGELPALFDGTRLWSAKGPALSWFRRGDYIADVDGSRTGDLDTAVRNRVEQALGFRPDGPVRMLTHMRYFGTNFNPVTFYYCFEPGGERVAAIVAEITNTPWKERHAYVLDARDGCGAGEGSHAKRHRWTFTKVFHVSPFMPLGQGYDWSFETPAATLRVAMALRDYNAADAPSVFGASLMLERVEITPAALRRTLLAYPFMTARVVGRIHWEALRLWLKGVKSFANPGPPASASTPVRAGSMTARSGESAS